MRVAPVARYYGYRPGESSFSRRGRHPRRCCGANFQRRRRCNFCPVISPFFRHRDFFPFRSTTHESLYRSHRSPFNPSLDSRFNQLFAIGSLHIVTSFRWRIRAPIEWKVWWIFYRGIRSLDIERTSAFQCWKIAGRVYAALGRGFIGNFQTNMCEKLFPCIGKMKYVIWGRDQ